MQSKLDRLQEIIEEPAAVVESLACSPPPDQRRVADPENGRLAHPGPPTSPFNVIEQAAHAASTYGVHLLVMHDYD